MGFGAAAASSRGIHKEATRRPFDSLGSELNHLATTTLCSNIVGIIYDSLVVTHTGTHLRSSTMCSMIIKVGSTVNFFFYEPQSTLLLLQRCDTSTDHPRSFLCAILVCFYSILQARTDSCIYPHCFQILLWCALVCSLHFLNPFFCSPFSTFS